MKYLKKSLILAMSLCMILAFGFGTSSNALSFSNFFKTTFSQNSSKKNNSSKVKSDSASEDTQVYDSKATPELKYFPVTMYKYNTDTLNKATKSLESNNGKQGIYFNGGGDKTNIDGSNITNKYWNRWSANSNSNSSTLRVSAITGLVDSNLDKETGKIKFNYLEAGILDPDNFTGKSIYTNVKMPFRYDSATGYYEFDSSKENVYFTNGQGKSSTTLNYNGNGFTNTDTTSGSEQKGFYPFNSGNRGRGNYHFGMNMAVNFFMTENGKINGTNEDIVFEFSGDDDVWVFIDGKLVLDIGGIHDATSGTINFATGDVTNPRTLSNINYDNTQGTSSKDGTTTKLTDILGGKLDTSKAHTLQIFYLERGKGASNCHIKFNLPTTNELSISKKFDDSLSGLTQEDIEKVKNQAFKFTATRDGEALSEVTYQLYENNTEIDVDKENKTDKDGKFTLKAGQTARFYNPSTGKYVVTENEDDFSKTWTAGKVGSTTSTSTTNSSPAVQIDSVNTSDVYSFVCENALQPILNDDAVVLDFGKPIDINVTKNDYLKGALLDSVNMDKSTTNYGSIKKKDANNVTYTLNKFMNGVDKAQYSVKFNNGKSSKSANITMIPATSVYYEDDFDTKNGKEGIVYSDNWQTAGSSNGGTQDDGTIGENSPYGYDSSYAEDAGDSNGSSHYIVATTNLETATFTFTGTGCELYSRTSNNTGRVDIKVYRGRELTFANRIKNVGIDTLYKEKDKTLYNIPIFNITDLKYGEYTVVVTARKGTAAIPRNTFYLDGVRIYNPLGEDHEAYKKDNENDAKVVELRDKLIADGIESETGSISGIIFTDKNAGETTSDITKYTNEGPKNEVYLKPQQSITFKLNDLLKDSRVQIGLKSPEGKSASISVNDKNKPITTKSTIDMYYDITSYINEDGTVTIKNTGSQLISLTKIKVTNVESDYEIFNKVSIKDINIY